MKYRNSFVTNSSSSSYIIAVKKERPKTIPICESAVSSSVLT